MTLLEIQDERTKLLDANDQITELSKAENRAKTEGELGTMQANLRRLKELDVEEETEKYKVKDGSEVRTFAIKHAQPREKFSLLRELRNRADGKPYSDIARDVFTMGKHEFAKSEVSAAGEIILPSSIEGRANELVAGIATLGQEIVAEDKKVIMPPLTNKLVFSQAGATFMPNMIGNVSIPTYSGTTVGWKGEIAAADQGTPTFGEVEFAPKRLTGYIYVSKLFLAQDSVGAERLLLDNMANAVARQLEATILGPATDAATYPQGIGYQINNANATTKAVLTGATITWAKMVGLESSVDTANALQGNLAYITNSIARGILKTTDKGIANDTGDFLMSEDNMINGYPVLVTNSIGSGYGSGADGNLVVFGNWRDLCICQWGGYDITVDPYTYSINGMVRIVINAYFDAKGLRGDGGTSGADLNQYYASFACESIK